MLTIRVKPSAFNSVYYPHLKERPPLPALLRRLVQRQELFPRHPRRAGLPAGTKLPRGAQGGEDPSRLLLERDTQKAITRHNLNNQFRIRQSDMIIEAKASGAQIVFAGLDDVEKDQVHHPGQGSFHGYLDGRGHGVRLRRLQAAGQALAWPRQVFKKRFTLSFNPVYLTHWIYVEFFLHLGRQHDVCGARQHLNPKDHSQGQPLLGAGRPRRAGKRTATNISATSTPTATGASSATSSSETGARKGPQRVHGRGREALFRAGLWLFFRPGSRHQGAV